MKQNIKKYRLIYISDEIFSELRYTFIDIVLDIQIVKTWNRKYRRWFQEVLTKSIGIRETARSVDGLIKI